MVAVLYCTQYRLPEAKENTHLYCTYLLYDKPRVIEVVPLVTIVGMPAMCRIVSEVCEARMVRDCEQRIDAATAVADRIYHSEHQGNKHTVPK